MKKLSIIIPIYNAEKYLGKCLESAIGQDYKNIEFICVNDGSTDSSFSILNEYAKKDSRIVVINQKNSGESAARNTGIKECTGDYIAFLDCDDWIEQEMYTVLISSMEEFNVDIVTSGWMKEYADRTVIMKNKEKISDKIFDRDRFLFYIYNRDAYQEFAYIWNKLYKREMLFDKYGQWILFDESLQLGADVLFLARIALNAKSVYHLDKTFYHYRQRMDSGSHTIDLRRRMDWLSAYENVISLFEHENIDQNILKYVKRFLGYHSSNTAEIAYQQKNESELDRCIKLMKLYLQEYEETNLDFPERVERYRKIIAYRL